MAKRYKEEKFYSVMTPEKAAEQGELLDTLGKEEGAVSFDIWFGMIGKADPHGTLRAAMRAYTPVTKATPSKWVEIFEKF